MVHAENERCRGQIRSEITQILHPDLEKEMEMRSVIGRVRLFCSEERMEREPGAMKGL